MGKETQKKSKQVKLSFFRNSRKSQKSIEFVGNLIDFDFYLILIRAAVLAPKLPKINLIETPTKKRQIYQIS